MVYDGRDQVTGIVYSDDGGVTTPDVSGIVYDGVGRRTAMTDGSGTSSWEWNAFGELVEHTAGNGDVLAYSYDGRGLQAEVVYPGNKTITRTFDDAGRWVGLVACESLLCGSRTPRPHRMRPKLPVILQQIAPSY